MIDHPPCTECGRADCEGTHKREADDIASRIVLVEGNPDPTASIVSAALFNITGKGGRTINTVVFPDGAQYAVMSPPVGPPKLDAKAIEELIAESSIGGALEDIRTRGIDAHLVELERELSTMSWPRARPAESGRQRNRRRWRKQGRR